MKYKNKPVVIEAKQFTDETKDQVFSWIDCNKMPSWDADDKPTIVIQTLEGDMTASIGDYVIKGVNGEFYPCKPDIFEKTYEPVNNEPFYNENLNSKVGISKNLNPPPMPNLKETVKS